MALCRQKAIFQGEIAVRIVTRIVHQHQVGEKAFCEPQVPIVQVRPDIAVDYEERPGVEQRQRPEDAATGLQRLPFRRIADLGTPARAIAQRSFNAMAKMSVIDNDVAKTGGGQTLDMVDDQWLAGRFQ